MNLYNHVTADSSFTYVVGVTDNNVVAIFKGSWTNGGSYWIVTRSYCKEEEYWLGKCKKEMKSSKPIIFCYVLWYSNWTLWWKVYKKEQNIVNKIYVMFTSFSTCGMILSLCRTLMFCKIIMLLWTLVCNQKYYKGKHKTLKIWSNKYLKCELSLLMLLLFVLGFESTSMSPDHFSIVGTSKNPYIYYSLCKPQNSFISWRQLLSFVILSFKYNFAKGLLLKSLQRKYTFL